MADSEFMTLDQGEIIGYETDETVFHKGDLAKYFAIIRKGRVNMITSYGIFAFREGDFIGLPNCCVSNYLNDYVADGDLEIERYQFGDTNYLGSFLSTNLDKLRPVLDSYMRFTGRLLEIFNVLMDLSTKIHTSLKSDYDKLYKLSYNDGTADMFHSREIERLNPEYKYGIPSQEQFDFMDEFRTLVENPEGKIDISPQISAVLLKRQSELQQVMMVNCENMYSYLLRATRLYFGKDEKSLFTKCVSYMEKLMADENENLMERIGELKSMLDLAREFSLSWISEINGQCPVDVAYLEHISAHIIQSKEVEGAEDAHELEDQKKKMDDLNDLLEALFQFAQYDKEKKEEFLTAYNEYLKIAEDKFRDPESNRAIRGMEEVYYNLYLALFLQSEQKKEVPLAVKLCLDYGIISEKLFNMADLIPFAELVPKGIYHSKYKIYTMSQWLHLIYTGKREPSRNDMDVDYKDLLKELKKRKSFTPEDEKKFLSDRIAKTSFEVMQMFRSNSRMVFASNATFCPFIRGEEFATDLSKQLIKGEDFEEALTNIRKIDFSLFYREAMIHYEKPRSEYVPLTQEILPEIILIPNMGQRGVMWQEIADHKKSNPARITFPMFPFGNIQEMLYPVLAKYRWEYVRTDEGMRWNDVTEHSLTAEYYQYIQFYKKNSSLPDAVKQKIKERLTAHKTPQDFFEADYLSWVKFESTGASRLNRVTREIMCKYVPFSKEIRDKLRSNPMFGDQISRYEVVAAKKIKLIEQRMVIYRRDAGSVPEEMEEHVRLLSK